MLCTQCVSPAKLSVPRLLPPGTFEPTEENRLEWHELHAQLRRMEDLGDDGGESKAGVQRSTDHAEPVGQQRTRRRAAPKPGAAETHTRTRSNSGTSMRYSSWGSSSMSAGFFIFKFVVSDD